MTLYDKISALNAHDRDGYWARRINAQLSYAASLSQTLGGKFDALAEQTADFLLKARADEGCVTRDAALLAETMLSPAAAEAKKLKVRCVAHAHIDMNWMWGFQETAAVTVDTFRTILGLMDEYPDFTFAQSQASTYKIIEDFCPELLGKIRARIHEGRWEVSASTWVETDKNMPNGESLCRHILYTKDYLSRLFDIPPETLELDFEPDTFGHNITVPEILSKGGVKYYYHCRGAEGAQPYLYNWRSRSGERVLVYREPHWYNSTVRESDFVDAPQFCSKYGVDVMLNVYGVGDHGGGPTRRDIELLLDMASWPVYPTVSFGTFRAFFKELEAFADKLPVVEGELNYIFTGCYTSQSRIKAANRISEDRLYESEALYAAASLLGAPDRGEIFAEAWRGALFNHFHDILPGSGLIETREYAMGGFQRVLAAANTAASAAMLTIGGAVNTLPYAGGEDISRTVSEGAGAGFGVGDVGGGTGLGMIDTGSFSLPSAERGAGRRRVFCLFNTTQYDFDSAAVVTAWDWEYDGGRAEFRSADGSVLTSQLLRADKGYWNHKYMRFAVRVKVPALGYTVITLDEAHAGKFALGENNQRDHIDDSDIVLENELVKAVFSRRTAELVSFTLKASGSELIDSPSCMFRLITENNIHDMSSWRVGNAKKIENINSLRGVNVSGLYSGAVRSGLSYTAEFGERSRLRVDVHLDAGSTALRFDVSADFHELGSPSRRETPRLTFSVPVAYTPAAYRRDVPFGTLDTQPLSHDIPVNSFLAAVPESGAGIMVTSDSKYGFRGCDNSVSVSLIRGSYDPDPCPEYGLHHIKLAVCALPSMDNASFFAASGALAHPVAAISVKPSEGRLAPEGALLKLTGSVRLSSVKNAEDGDGLVVRICDLDGEGSEFGIETVFDIARAELCGIDEKPVSPLPVAGRTVTGYVKPYAFETIRLF